jgi:arylsulfatase
MPPGLETVRPWGTLTPDEQALESRKMELYAAMVENLDRHVGRLVALLDERGELDNTVILFISDNGAAGEDFYNVGPFREWLRRHWTNTLENLGTAESYAAYGPQWAQAGSAPFHGYKQWPTEGGIVAPFIAAGPGVSHTGAVNRGRVGVQDLAPTILEMAGIRYPGALGTDATLPMTGTSVVPVLTGEEPRAHDPSEVMVLEHRNRAYVRQGRWKIVAMEQPLGPETFRLYDMEHDPGETTDVSGQFPDQYSVMLGLWEAYRVRVGVYVAEEENPS